MASQYQATSYDEANTGYVQGAGDDNEMWSQGLTSRMWWKCREELLEAGEEEIREVIDRIVLSERKAAGTASFADIIGTEGRLKLGGLPVGKEVFHADQDGVGMQLALIVCCATKEELEEGISTELRKKLGKKILWLGCGTGKAGSKALRKELLKLSDFISSIVNRGSSAVGTSDSGIKKTETAHSRKTDVQAESMHHLSHSDLQVLVADIEGGKDIAVGVALALLALYSDENGRIDWSTQIPDDMDKAVLRKKLSWITTSMPSANPARATLNAVNECLFRR